MAHMCYRVSLGILRILPKGRVLAARTNVISEALLITWRMTFTELLSCLLATPPMVFSPIPSCGLHLSGDVLALFR